MAKKGAGRGVAAVLLTAALTVVLGLVCFGAVSLLAGPRAQLASVTLQQTPAPDVVTPPPAAVVTPRPAPEAVETTPEMTPEATPEPTPVPDSVVTIRVVGDIMCHDRQLEAALREDGSYEMDAWFDAIRE